MDLHADHTSGQGKELRILAYVVLAYAVYSLASGLFNIVDTYIWPRLFADTSRPLRAMPWSLALVTLFSMALTVTIAGLSYAGIKARQPRGWWLGGTLFAQMVISSSLGIAQVILMRIPPGNLPLYTANPVVLVRGGIALFIGMLMLFYLCRTSVMQALSIDAGRKSRELGRLFLLGLLLTLMHTVLVTAIIAVSMR